MRHSQVRALFIIAVLILLLCEVWIAVHWQMYALALLLFIAFNAYGSAFISSQFYLPVICRGTDASDAVALTFDDGPIPGQTEEILEILKRYEVPGAFFCIGSRVTQHAPIVARMHQEGHLVGNHTFSHSYVVDLLSTRRIKDELMRTGEAIKKVIGVTPCFFRPPYGVTNPMIARAVADQQYTAVGWSVRSHDTVSSSVDKLLARTSSAIRGGDIVLFHDYSAAMRQALPSLIEAIRKRGLRLVRLDELLRMRAYS